MLNKSVLLATAILLLCQNVTAQFIEKHNLIYRNTPYDIFMIRLDSSLQNRFAFLENTGLLSEKILFDSVAGNFNSPFFAVTASIVDSMCQPLGLFVSNAKQFASLNHGQGNGNFYLKPNGYLTVDATGMVRIIDAESVVNVPKPDYAIQSGPMLVINGLVNSAFNKDSKNLNVRCGVGITEQNGKKRLLFIKSNGPVSFFQFAQLFSEKYKCKDVLNLESGTNCSIHLPTSKEIYSDDKKVCRFLIIRL